MTLNEIRQKRAEHWEMMKNFLDTHEDKNGNLNADDAATYANYEKVMDDFDKAVERAQNREQREQQIGHRRRRRQRQHRQDRQSVGRIQRRV